RQGLLVFAQGQDPVVHVVRRDRARGKAQRRGVPLHQDRPRPLRPSPRCETLLAPDGGMGDASGVARLSFQTRRPETRRPQHSCTGTPPMAKSSKVPPHALRLSSYGELEAYVRAFAAGHLHLLLLFGPPGVGKSRAVRSALDPRVGWISGQATPLGIYLQAFA